MRATPLHTPLFTALVAARVIDLRHRRPATLMSPQAFIGALVKGTASS